MVVAALAITFEREKVVDFSFPFRYETFGMLTTTLSQDQFYLFKPLETSIWLCYICAAALLSSWLYLRVNEMKSGKTEPATTHFINCVWYIIRMAAYQGMFLCFLQYGIVC